MKQNMERRSRPLIALYLALIVMLALTPIVGLADDPTPGPTDTPTETAVPIDTVVPPATEAPTETSTPEQVATNTPAPEAETPVPTETLPDLPAPTAVVPATLTSLSFESEADTFVSDDASSADTNYGSEKSLNVAENPLGFRCGKLFGRESSPSARASCTHATPARSRITAVNRRRLKSGRIDTALLV